MSSVRIDLPGARLLADGARFTVWAPGAEAVDLCFFASADAAPTTGQWALRPDQAGSWEITLPGISAGQLYGYRVHGPWAPHRGVRHNSAKLLIDPAAAAVAGSLRSSAALADFEPRTGQISANPIDTAALVPKAVVVDTAFDWQSDRPPATPWDRSVIYECHVRGLTRLHPEVPEPLRGTYLGLAHEAVIDHLRRLGVTAVELMPVQHFVSEAQLVDRGLVNYFGYNPIAWVAPHAGYATADRGAQVVEFKQMVRALHRAGIEVILDMVFNHTAEGDHRGPVLSLRGLDNGAFYRLDRTDARLYENLSGCGNTLHFGQSATIELAVASLRYWAQEMHVDGFRFDLATILARDPVDFDPAATFLERLRADPILGSLKLIAEPWDVGPNGYQLGRFPSPWREWNDRYRDAVRAFWRGDPGHGAELRRRVAGSFDLFARPTRAISASINFVTCHDGFTLEDLVSYEQRHNLANGEDNRDGHHQNLSSNWGVEGPTDTLEIRHLRQLVKRNLMATLAVSVGVPMLSHGDELGRTQSGNNNAYCHDSELTWVDWHVGDEAGEFLRFVEQAFALRRQHFSQSVDSEAWIESHGAVIGATDTFPNGRRPFGWLRHSAGRTVLTIFNGNAAGHLFELPSAEGEGHWQVLLDTVNLRQRRLRGHAVRVPAHALLILAFETGA